MAAPRPTASAMLPVPASKRPGASWVGRAVGVRVLVRIEGRDAVDHALRLLRCRESGCRPQLRRLNAWVTLLPAGTLSVSQTLPPMVEPLPTVMRPSTVAPA